MRWPACIPETVSDEAIYRWHPMFAQARFDVSYHGADAAPATIEGGDILVIGNGGAVLVGMSERTTPQAVEVLAHRLFEAGRPPVLVAIDMPKTRAFMHLDTLLTMADHGVFTKYAGMGMLPSYTVEPGASATELKVTDHPPEDMHRAMAAALDRPFFITVLTAVQDVHSAQREQWDDGCNVLAVRTGSGRGLRAERDHQHLPAGQRHRGAHRPGRRTRPRPGRPPLHELPHRTRRLSPHDRGQSPISMKP